MLNYEFPPLGRGAGKACLMYHLQNQGEEAVKAYLARMSMNPPQIVDTQFNFVKSYGINALLYAQGYRLVRGLLDRVGRKAAIPLLYAQSNTPKSLLG